MCFPMQKWSRYPTVQSLLGLDFWKIVTAQSKQNVLPFSSGGTIQEARSSSLGPLGLCHTFTFLVNVLRRDRLLKINFLQRSLISECPESVRYIQSGKARLVLLSALHKGHPWALEHEQCRTKPSSTRLPACNLQLILDSSLSWGHPALNTGLKTWQASNTKDSVS